MGVCQGEERLEVHRNILAARSVVFRTMVDVDMVERKTNTIEIKEFEVEVVKEFVNFLYSDKIAGNFFNFAEMMKIGHQYQVSSLVEECAKHLVQEVSTDNIAQLGKLAEAFEAVELSDKCAEFVAEQFEIIDEDILDSIPSSLYRKSFATYRGSKQKPSVTEGSSQTSITEVDLNEHQMNFFTSLGDPIVVKENSSISTRFKVTRSVGGANVKLAGVGLYISQDKIPIEITLSSTYSHGRSSTPSILMTMSTTITSTDCSKPLKINFPSSVYLPGCDHLNHVEIKLGKECINFKGDGAKHVMSIPMKKGDLTVQIFNGNMQVPVLYFDNL